MFTIVRSRLRESENTETSAPQGRAECQKDDKIVLSANKYESAGTTCAVDWVSETAGPRGPPYAAHMECRRGRSLGSDFGSLKNLQRCADT
jgi:hypothetical protein